MLSYIIGHLYFQDISQETLNLILEGGWTSLWPRKWTSQGRLVTLLELEACPPVTSRKGLAVEV